MNPLVAYSESEGGSSASDSSVTITAQSSPTPIASAMTVPNERAALDPFTKMAPKWHHVRWSANIYLVCDLNAQKRPLSDPFYTMCRDFTKGRINWRWNDAWLDWFRDMLAFRSRMMGTANEFKIYLGLHDLPSWQQYDVRALHRNAIELAMERKKSADYLKVRTMMEGLFPYDPSEGDDGRSHNIGPFVPKVAMYLAAGLYLHHRGDMVAIAQAFSEFDRLREEGVNPSCTNGSVGEEPLAFGEDMNPETSENPFEESRPASQNGVSEKVNLPIRSSSTSVQKSQRHNPSRSSSLQHVQSVDSALEFVKPPSPPASPPLEFSNIMPMHPQSSSNNVAANPSAGLAISLTGGSAHDSTTPSPEKPTATFKRKRG